MPWFWTGSMITIATVSGEAVVIACSRVPQEEVSELRLGLLNRAHPAVGVPYVDDPGNEWLEGRPQTGDAVDRERAHRRPVVGVSARDHLPATLAACGCVLPANFHAVSTASDPPEVKKTRPKPFGASEATSAASSIAGGCACPQIG